jgi:hypothetical protein
MPVYPAAYSAFIGGQSLFSILVSAPRLNDDLRMTKQSIMDMFYRNAIRDCHLGERDPFSDDA